MRLWVRPGVRVMLSIGFSWALACIPDAPKNEALDQLFHPISR